MRVYCGKSIGMVDIYSPAKAEGFYLYPCYITICCRMHLQVFHPVGLKVEPHMIVIGAKLTEVAARLAGIFSGLIKYPLG